MDFLFRSPEMLGILELEHRPETSIQGDLQHMYFIDEIIEFDRYQSTCLPSHDKCANTRK